VHLDSQDLALSNMGGYDAQTVAGVMSTSTHGSGMAFGPLADQVRSFDLVGSGGIVYRIEPAGGPTDPTAFESFAAGGVIRWRLVQDDAWFQAAVVGMGSLGIIYSVLLNVEPKYWLKEVRSMHPWAKVKADLLSGRVLAENRHYELLFNPYAVDGINQCLVTTRNTTPRPDRLPKDKRERNVLSETFASLSITRKVANFLFDWQPRLTPDFLNEAVLAGLVDNEYSNLSYKVLNIGGANQLPAYSMEIGVPMERNLHILAIERIMTIAETHRQIGEVYETAPIAVRFVRGSEAFMSMMYGRDTAMLELIMLSETEGGYELLGVYEEALYELSGRPHWGQVNYLNGNREFLRALYPMLEEWLMIRRQLDPRGTFDSPFTKRLGLSRFGYLPD